MKKTFFIAALIVSIGLAACTKQDASFATVEEQRAQGRANAASVASDYQRQNPRIQGWEAIVKADATHTANCPQGGGWWINLREVECNTLECR
jgi:hypothetical protein